MTTLSSQIKTYLKNETGWLSGSSLERIEFATSKGGTFKTSSIGRVLRLLEGRKEIEKEIRNGTVFYRILTPPTNVSIPPRKLVLPSGEVKPEQGSLLAKEFVYDNH